jgi:hypothetical protein
MTLSHPSQASHDMSRQRTARRVALAAAVLAAAACSDGVGPIGPQSVSLSFQVTGPGPAPVSGLPAG